MRSTRQCCSGIQASSPLCAPVRTRTGNSQPVGVELLHGRARRAGAGEQGEQVPDGLLHTGIRVEHDVADRVVDQADGQADL